MNKVNFVIIKNMAHNSSAKKSFSQLVKRGIGGSGG